MRHLRHLVGALALVLAPSLGGCTIPVSMDPASFGRATVEIQNDTVRPDGTKETCHAKAVAGMEASGVDVSASLCHGGDKLAGKAASLSGKDAQLGELDAWAKLSDAEQQRLLEAGRDALKIGGPAACVAVLTAMGVPAATPLCAALAGVVLPPAPVVVPPAPAIAAAQVRVAGDGAPLQAAE